MPTIYVSDPIHDEVLAELRGFGDVHLGYGPDAVTYSDVCRSVDAVLLRGEKFTRAMIEASPRLRIIARHGVGTDNVDLDAADKAGVWVTNTPGANSRAVAEHVFALTLTLARKVTFAAGLPRSGLWRKGRADNLTGFELHGRTLGLLGLGNIGTLVAGLGRAFGMHLLVTDPAAGAATVEAVGGRKVELDELLAGSDMVSLHLPLVPATRHIIGAGEFARMRPGALLINTSRGGLVDETALVGSLRSGRLGGAALDVLEAENTDLLDPLPHNLTPLAEFDNLLVTPHIGGHTEESGRKVADTAAACIRQALSGQVPDNIVPPPDPTAP